mgnify:CR=1 FL=1
MAFYLESEGHTKTVVNGKVIDNRGYEAVSNSKGTNLIIKQDGKKFLLQDNPILNIPANPTSLILRFNSDFLKRKKKKTRRRKSKSKRKKRKYTKRH